MVIPLAVLPLLISTNRSRRHMLYMVSSLHLSIFLCIHPPLETFPTPHKDHLERLVGVVVLEHLVEDVPVSVPAVTCRPPRRTS